MKKITVQKRVLTAAFLSALGHIFTVACQSLLSLLQKLPLFWSINILLGSLFSYAHKWTCTAMQMPKFISMHCQACTHTDTESLVLLFYALMSWCLAIWILRIRFSSLGPWRHQWRRVLFQFWIPLRTIEDVGWCVRAERAQHYL